MPTQGLNPHLLHCRQTLPAEPLGQLCTLRTADETKANERGREINVRFCARLVHILEKAMAPDSSTLAWKIPWMEKPGGLQSVGLLSRTQLSDFTFTFHFHALEKEMATHSSVLAWRISGTGEPGGLPSMGSHRVGHDCSDLAAAAGVHIFRSELVI